MDIILSVRDCPDPHVGEETLVSEGQAVILYRLEENLVRLSLPGELIKDRLSLCLSPGGRK